MTTHPANYGQTAEDHRLKQSRERSENWKRWGPYLSERQWGTVREDYSEHGVVWDAFPHDHARSRAYRWGEDGLLGITDRECRLCFAWALWNGNDPILKERLFGLTGPEGNHGEDVKEEYFYLDSTPTHSYMKALYKYPQGEYPYEELVAENRNRGHHDPEFELVDTGIFEDNRYFDVVAEYAKAGPNDLLIRLTVTNRGPNTAPLHVLPTLWFRNTWSWGCNYDDCTTRPNLELINPQTVRTAHESLGKFLFQIDPANPGSTPEWLFAENETHFERIFGIPNQSLYVKDSFHRKVIEEDQSVVNPDHSGTKSAAWYRLELEAGESAEWRFRLTEKGTEPPDAFGPTFEQTFATRISEADAFFQTRNPSGCDEASRQVARQAYAGLLWTKQFYHYAVREWLSGDPNQPAPPFERQLGRNHDWPHLFNRDVISMPDKWEYPWYAAWDLAFHMLPFAEIDADFAKQQMILFLREWYMHPNGQIPAYEFALSDVNPPVHAWGCWRVYKITEERGHRDRAFLERSFHKLMLNFTWWVNRKDPHGRNLFAGGFLGLDNIGVFDRSKPLPTGGHLEQADGTAWMAFFCGTMLSMALELADHDPVYEDVASKFFEHYIAIADAMNSMGGTGLWDEEDGFYYDRLMVDGNSIPLKTRSLVGLVPLFAVEVLENDVIERLPGFKKRMEWFLSHRPDLASQVTYMQLDCESGEQHGHRLLAIPSRERLARVFKYLFDENEFLSPFGIRSLSKYHEQNPYIFRMGNEEFQVEYQPAESDSGLFGGNSNWRGPIWLPMNYLILEALERYWHFYGDEFQVEFPTGSGRMMSLREAACEIARRLCALFLFDENGRRPCHGEDERYTRGNPGEELVLFYEYFHGDNGRGVGASHQTGWTALVTRLISRLTKSH